MDIHEDAVTGLRSSLEQARSCRDQLVASIDLHRERGADVTEARAIQQHMEYTLREMQLNLDRVLQ
jgi:hypothetical protein